MDKHEEVIKSDDVGSLEEALGKNDPLFHNDENPVVGFNDHLIGKEASDTKEEPNGGGHGHSKPIDLTETQIETETVDLGKDNVVTAKDYLKENPVIRDTVIGDKLEEMTLPREVRIKDIPEEVEITHLKNLENGKVFEVNPHLIRRKDLIPCDEDGNKVYDNRRLGRFN